MSRPFSNNQEYLNAELNHLRLLLRCEVTKWRQPNRGEPAEMFKGMYIADGEIDSLLEDMTHDHISDDARRLRRQASRLRRQIVQRRLATIEAGVFLPLANLARIFALSDFEEQVILLCLAPELDPRYEKLVAYLHDDVSRKLPTVKLALQLFCASRSEALKARSWFSPQSPLFRAQIIGFNDESAGMLSQKSLCLDDRIANYLIGSGGMDKDMQACFRPLPQTPDLKDLRWPHDLTSRILRLTESHLKNMHGVTVKLIFNLYGPTGVGRKALAAALCRELGLPLIRIDVREALLRYRNFGDAIRRLAREALLSPAAVFLEHCDVLWENREKADVFRQNLLTCIDESLWLTFLSTESAWEPGGLLRDHLFESIPMPAPELQSRSALWVDLSRKYAIETDGVDWDDLAVKFRLTPGQMQAALFSARNSALLQSCDPNTITKDELYRACRSQSNQKLAETARKVVPRHSWADITLPPNEVAQLREVCAQLKHRQTVYGKWGFGNKLSLSKGLCVLFFGQSGAGKTLAVEIVARELRLEAYKIDLSSVVSKYIGETEKNLSAIFREAETSNAILFFDEADALFGKRSEVKDAHDRYANIEINYLLQRMPPRVLRPDLHAS